MSSIERVIDRQLRKWELEKSLRVGRRAEHPEATEPRPVITVSRERGSGGTIVADHVAGRLGYTLLHRDVIDRISQSTGTRRQIIESLDERVKPQVTIWFESMLNLNYVDSSDYVRNLLETITSIARLGGVVVVGRGANFMIPLHEALHVRIVAPRELRVQRVMETTGKARREAEREVDEVDHERREFVRHLAGRDIDDPRAYDLVVNTGELSIEAATGLVVDAAFGKFARLRAAAHEDEPAVRAG